MKTDASAREFARAKTLFPGGVNSPVRAFKGVLGDPLFIARGEKARLFDEDGNSFIDYVLSWGPLLARARAPAHRPGDRRGGAARDFVRRADRARESCSARKSASSCRRCEKMRFVSSGTEATQSALRVARGFTGRERVVKFEGCFHGAPIRCWCTRARASRRWGCPTRRACRRRSPRDDAAPLQRRAGGARLLPRSARARDRLRHRRAGGRQHGRARPPAGLSRGAARGDPQGTARSSSATR